MFEHARGPVSRPPAYDGGVPSAVTATDAGAPRPTVAPAAAQPDTAARPPSPPEFDAFALTHRAPSRETLLLLLGVDPAVLSSDDAVAAAAGCEFGKRLLDGLQLEFLAVADRKRTVKDLFPTGEELAAAAKMAPHSAQHRVEVASSAVRRLPETVALLKAGKLRLSHVEDVERATRGLTDDEARQVDARVGPDPMGLKRRVAAAIAQVAPEAAKEKAEKAKSERDATYWNDGVEGRGGIELLGPLAGVAQIKAAIDSLAKAKHPGDSRLLGTRRFDVLYDWARKVLGLPAQEDASPVEKPCSACGRTAASIPYNVTISLEALLKLSEAPGDLDGHPIPASVARELAANSRWRRFVTEPHTGRLLDVGATTYRPTEALLRFVRARDRSCVFPGCTLPAYRCDCDHTAAFHTAGGKTIQANLAPLCRRHHRCKHELGFTYGRQPTDQTRWTLPSGRTYVNEPERYADDPTLTAYLTGISQRKRAREQAKHPPPPKPEPDDEPPF